MIVATHIAASLTGDYRREHLCILHQELTLYEVYQQQIIAVNAEIEKCLASFEPKTLDEPPTPGRKRRKKPTANHPNFDLHKYLYRMAGVDFTLIDGLDALTVQTILSEVGLNPKRFPSVKHFASWLGLCPGQKVTDGKVKSSQTRMRCQSCCKCFSHGGFFPDLQPFCSGCILSPLTFSLGRTQSNNCYCTQAGSFVLQNLDNCWTILRSWYGIL